jgi:hypothetical protein
MTPPFRADLEKGNNSISASIPTLPGWAFKGGGKSLTPYSLKNLLPFWSGLARLL